MPASPFQPLHAALRAQVDQGFLPGVSTALLREREVVDRFVRAARKMEADGWWWSDPAVTDKMIRRGILKEMIAAWRRRA